ncbi:MAG: S1C family serine protease [Anaerolineae bacterium]|nr:S1C family serine protease [Anaerolineae bacterium]
MPGIFQQLNTDLAAVIGQASNSLVRVGGDESYGAGTIWHSDGLVVTNAHVIHRRHDIHVTLPNGDSYPAAVLAADPDLDLAALSITASGLPVIEPGDSRQLHAGQLVMALGHPWGRPGAVTSGVVIGIGDHLPEMPPGKEWIALDLHIRPGHSGGPLLDTNGRLVGINTMITGPNVGFAIPVQTVKTFLKAHLGSKQKQTV